MCLMSRTESRLVEVAEELKGKFQIETRHLAVDFSNVSGGQWDQIRALMEELEVGILINNVGCSYEHYEYLHLVDDATVDRLIEVNIRTTTQVREAYVECTLKYGVR